jgi:hypothetical protein
VGCTNARSKEENEMGRTAPEAGAAPELVAEGLHLVKRDDEAEQSDEDEWLEDDELAREGGAADVAEEVETNFGQAFVEEDYKVEEMEELDNIV